MKIWSVLLVAVLALGAAQVDAKRLGGGKSVGKQSNNVSQREAAPTPPAASPQNAAAKPGAPAPAAAAQPAKRPWGAMLGGLAAGLGLAWLASSLGLGEGFAQFLLIALVVGAIFVAIKLWRRSRQAPAQANSPYAFAGAGAAQPLPQYNADKIGNDASARPWERNTTAFEAPQQTSSGSGIRIGSAIGAGASAPLNWTVPADFDVENFIAAAKRNFTALQHAWDLNDTATLRGFMTDAMFSEIKTQLSERDSHLGGQPNRTEVAVLEAQLLGVEELDDHYLASVEFSGMIREEPAAGPAPFREVWNMAKPKDGSSGWLVAGIQALQ